MLDKYGFNVSRETNKKIIEYIKILEKWNNSINLISKNSQVNIWERHVLDSAQIWPLLGETRFKKWVDLGSGAGFPGIVLSILAKDTFPFSKFILIEKDKKKSEFLNIISKKLDLNFVVYSDRIENLNCLKADVISARALSSLRNLLFYSKKHRIKKGVSFFLKGENIFQEIKDVKKSEDFSYTLHPSVTNPKSYIIAIGRHNE